MAIEWKAELTCELGVGDLPAAVEWWTGVMGWEVVFRSDEMGWAEVKTPLTGVTIGLNAAGTPGSDGGATLVFGVADIEAARGELEGKGVAFAGATEEIPDMVKLAMFADPWGNELSLAESLA